MFNFRYKVNERKMPNFLIVVIILLMIMQIFVTNRTVSKQRIEEMTERVFRMSDKIITDDESRYKSIVNLMATIYSDSDILTVLKNDDISNTDLTYVCTKMRKYASVAGDINNIYYYESKKNVFYDMMSYQYEGNDDRFSGVLNEIKKDKDERRVFLTQNELGDYFAQLFCYLFTPDPSEKDAIMIITNEMSFKPAYDEIQNVLASEMYVVLDNGTTLYGGGRYRLMEDISRQNFFVKRKNNVTYTEKKSGNAVYCYLNEPRMNKWYIVAIPLESIDNSLFNINYIYLYLGILISFASLIYILIFRLRLIEMMREYAAKSNKRKEAAEQSVKLRKKILDYVYEPDLTLPEELINYLSPGETTNSYSAFVFADINNYEDFKKNNRPSDLELFKYGIKNIMMELISQCGVDMFDMAGQQSCIEFLLTFSDKEKFTEGIFDKLSECITEIEKYIGVDISFFVSDCYEIDDIDKAYFQVENIRSYGYIYDSKSILSSSCIREENNNQLLAMRQRCSEFCRELGKSDEITEKEKLNCLFDEICSMNSMQAREVVWYLAININLRINSLNTQISVNSENNLMNDIWYASSMTEIKGKIEKNISNIYSAIEYNSKHKFDSTVDKCNRIIEAEYKDCNLSINSIAARLSLSVNYLGRNYKKQTGQSISETIVNRRLAEVERLLITTDEDVKDIAAKCGLTTHSSYLAGLFRKRYGMTPIDYRRSKKSNND